MSGTATPPQVDLNADLGESYGTWRLGDDEAMLALVSSANVACGFHAGDALTLRTATASAAGQGVVVGAQVGYNHLAGFGRWRIDVPRPELTADILYQLGALDGLCRVAGTRVRYLKPHGALYNTAVTDPQQAGALVDAVLDYDPTLPILGLPGSVLHTLATEAGLTVVAEAFADRGYASDGTLLPRDRPGALIDEPARVVERTLRMVTEGTVEAVDGTVVQVRPDSICLHSDTPGAVALARAVRSGLEDAGVRIAPFVPSPTESG